MEHKVDLVVHEESVLSQSLAVVVLDLAVHEVDVVVHQVACLELVVESANH